jgi:glycosyltransferase involved in cell wall biosynthesis
VNDGSVDGTAAVARSADEVVTLATNCGKGAALRAGFRAALARGVDVIVTMDADGQHDPASIPELVAALGNADLAIGERRRDLRTMPYPRRITNSLSSAALTAIVGLRLPDPQSGFRAMRRSVVETTTGNGDRYEFETEFLIGAVRRGFRLTHVPIRTIYGPRSHFRAIADGARIVRAIWRSRVEASEP